MGPLRDDDLGLRDRYMRAFEQFEVLELGVEQFVRAAELRARVGLRTPDALHLAASHLIECSDLWSYALTAIIMAGGFVLLPNLSAYLQFNLGYPRSQLGTLYLVGGAFSFFALRVFGSLVDRYGSFRVGTAGSALLIVLTWVW